MKALIALSSITYANKAKKLLNDMGLYCEIERTPKNLSSGCGYSIRVADNLGMILPLLVRNGIMYKDYMIIDGG